MLVLPVYWYMCSFHLIMNDVLSIYFYKGESNVQWIEGLTSQIMASPLLDYPGTCIPPPSG